MFQKQCWVIKKKNNEVCDGDNNKEKHCQMSKKTKQNKKTGTK